MDDMKEVRPPENERQQRAIQDFLGALMAQAQFRLARVETFLQERSINFERLGPSCHYKLKWNEETAESSGFSRPLRFRVEMPSNGTVIFEAEVPSNGWGKGRI